MFQGLRGITVHPALVHLPLGLVALAALAAVLSARRRSARWTFVGDVALWSAALSALVSGGFGALSFALLDWPTTLSPWPWVHLAVAAAGTLVLLAAGALRWHARRVAGVYRSGMVAAVLAGAALLGFAGWIGGEVLVFHGGMAVKAAGNGALAPSIGGATRTPKDVVDAMGRLAGAFGEAQSELSQIIADEPQPRRFEGLGRAAAALLATATWIRIDATGSAQSSTQGVGGAGVAGAPTEDAASERAEHLGKMAATLEESATALQRAAAAKDVVGSAQALGAVQSSCAACHLHLRWHGAGED